MTVTLELVAILVLGYLGTHFVARRVRQRFHIVSGIEFLVLGVLVGPHVAGVLRPDDLDQLQPVISVALGALGLVLGLRFRFARLIAQHGDSLFLAFFAVTTTVVLVSGGATFLTLKLYHPSQWPVALPAAVAFGILAAVSGPATVASIRTELGGGGRLAGILETAAQLSHVITTVLFGLVFCAFHLGETTLARPLTAVEWMVANLGFGILLGLLFFLFLGRERDEDRILLAILGIVLFASGTAYYLHLSPLFITLALGVMLSSTSTGTDAIESVLRTLEGPLMVVILVVAGASWNLATLTQPIAWIFLAVALLGRPVALTLGGWLSFRYGPSNHRLTPWMGGGLVAQEGLAIAMAYNLTQVYKGLGPDVLLSVVILSVLVWEFLSPSRVRAALLDAEPSLARTALVSSPPLPVE